MNAELIRLIDALIENTICDNCGAPLQIEAGQLNSESDGVYTSNYSCPGCEADYSIKIRDRQALLRLEYSRADDGAANEIFPGFQQIRKETLRRQSHPVKDLVEGYTELTSVLSILWQNKQRVTEARGTIRDHGLNYHDEEFKIQLYTDIHNYLSSAYTFDEILKTVEPNLPTDGPVEDANTSYNDVKRPIIGLRIYAQHYRIFPLKSSIIALEEPGEHDVSITVKLDDVDTIEPDIRQGRPSGYGLGFDHHYGDIEGDYIDIVSRINSHYEAAENLFDTIGKHAEEAHGDEIEDYRGAIQYHNE